MKKLNTIKLRSAQTGLALGLATLISGRAATIHVPADYTTIQDAVNAAGSGDEIQIAAGVYTNQVVITNKNLTLSGSPGTILRATPNMQETLPQFHPYGTVVPLLGIFESTNVVVSGLTFEGERLSDSQTGVYFGVWYLAAGGCVEDCRFVGFRGSTLNFDSNHSSGVGAVNPSGFGMGPVDFQVLRSTFADNALSIAVTGDTQGPSGVWSPELLLTRFVVDDNTVVGNGPVTSGVQFGISIGVGAGGEVKRNTITDYAYVGTTDPNPWSYGILAADVSNLGHAPLKALQPVQYEGNIFRNNQEDIWLLRGDGSTVANNSFEGATLGHRPSGLYFSGDNVTVASNRFSDMQTGIVLVGNDPDYSTFLGITSNAVLTANSFCNVTNNYDFEPLTTYDLQSTLGCDPTLNVTRSVLLSWPYAVQGYSVQTAPTPTGPWTNSDATVFQQDGQNSAAIPMDTNQQYFQLVKQP